MRGQVPDGDPAADERQATTAPGTDGEDSVIGWLARRYELFLAVRYLKVRRKQAFTSVVTGVSVLGVAVGVAALVIALALLTGFQEDIQRKIIGANAHVFIYDLGSAPIADYDEVGEVAEEVEGVVATAPAIYQSGLLIGEVESNFVNLKGIVSEAEGRTTDLLDRIVEGGVQGLGGTGAASGRASGAGTGPSPPGIVIGRGLADTMLVGVGDRVRLLIASPYLMTPFGSGFRPRTYRVTGIFEAGMYEYDNTWALIDLAEAQDLFELGDVASVIQVRVEDIYATGAVMESIEGRLGEGYFLTDWQEMNRVFFSALELERLAMFITISLIVMVAALNIVATLVLMVMEKQRDIGILLSMGASRRGVLYTFVIQGLTIGIVGTVLGLILGIGVSVLCDTYRLIGLPEQVYYLSYLPFTVRPVDFSVVALTAVGISFLATLYPAWRASRLDPVAALRYE